jgi:hypothetical protein
LINEELQYSQMSRINGERMRREGESKKTKILRYVKQRMKISKSTGNGMRNPKNLSLLQYRKIVIYCEPMMH